MTENTISIENEAVCTPCETEEETVEQSGETALQNAVNSSAAADEGEAKGEAAEENTISDEEMLTLTVYGDTVTVSKSEAISAAQRGVAFDSMKQKLALAKGDARLKALDDLAQISGRNVSQLLGDMTKQALSDSLVEKYGGFENVPAEEFEEAMNRAYTTRKSLEQTADRWMLEDRRSQLEEFLQHNPGCTEIPPEVIARAKQGENLTLAYSRYETQQLKMQLNQAQQEINMLKSRKAAKEKSMPSAKSAVAEGSAKSMYGMMKSLW